ncbi:MAG: porin [Gammaproteobacteria bacterium]|nr:porin [Gammaproteobacteria bacterium]
MNKKIISMAVAAALVAPMAAQAADVTVNGNIAGEIVSNDAGLYMQDNGQSKLVFNVKDAESGWYARYGMDIRLGRLQGEIAGIAGALDGDATAKGAKFATDRAAYVGVKMGAGSLQFGRATTVGANIEGDKFSGTFLEMRNNATAGGAYNSASFLNQVIQYRTKMGGTKLGVEYIASDVTSAGANPEVGHYAVSLKGKAGSIGYYLGMNNGNTSTGNDYMKVGASMAMGGMNLRLGMDDSPENTAKKTGGSKMHLGLDMKMGGGLLDVTFADAGNDNTTSYTRIAYKMKPSKSVTINTGYAINGNSGAGDTFGVGVIVGF